VFIVALVNNRTGDRSAMRYNAAITDAYETHTVLVSANFLNTLHT